MKWDVDKLNGVLWIAAEAAKSLCGSMEKETGIKFREHMCYCKGHLFHWCTLEKENEKVGNFLVERFADKSFAGRFVKDYGILYKKVVRELNRLDEKDFSELSSSELFDTLKKTTDFYIRIFDFGFIIEPMDFVMPSLIRSKLMKQGHSTSEIADMMAIADITFLNKETQELIRIAKEKKEKQKKLLKKHAYKYRWLQSAHVGRKDLPFSYFEERLNELKEKDLDKELKKLKNFRKDEEKIKKGILSKKPIDDETKKLLKAADVIAPLHDRRKELFLRIVYTLDTARAEIARRYGYTKEELSVFQIEELLKLKNNKKLDREYMRKLLKNALLYIDTEKGIWKYYAGEEAESIFKKETDFDLEATKEIKGLPVSLGKARGKIRIIHGVEDIGKMKAGEILLSSMTRPEFVPAIKKAAAIITDEGGVTCHAAIVSREMKIPCIVGTKIATKVLKDGDYVEVDANEGVIKIIR
ncbi:MAG: PEP-utilizing enzyme [Candidatus Woesearchaeota archaeon]|nr:PEP-utilizing enzyme [Candidatus Woesearchaeota archaeon]